MEEKGVERVWQREERAVETTTTTTTNTPPPQVCSNGTRIFVQRSIADAFTKQLISATQKLKVGDPMAEDTTVGATIHEDHAKKVLGYLASAQAEVRGRGRKFQGRREH